MNYESLRGKHLLLDTNILINYTKHPSHISGCASSLKSLRLYRYSTNSLGSNIYAEPPLLVK